MLFHQSPLSPGNWMKSRKLHGTIDSPLPSSMYTFRTYTHARIHERVQASAGGRHCPLGAPRDYQARENAHSSPTCTQKRNFSEALARGPRGESRVLYNRTRVPLRIPWYSSWFWRPRADCCLLWLPGTLAYLPSAGKWKNRGAYLRGCRSWKDLCVQECILDKK